jgi:hypothetical protein
VHRFSSKRKDAGFEQTTRLPHRLTEASSLPEGRWFFGRLECYTLGGCRSQEIDEMVCDVLKNGALGFSVVGFAGSSGAYPFDVFPFRSWRRTSSHGTGRHEIQVDT